MKQENMLRSRKGISMAEVVIALVLISVISAAAVSVVLRSVDIEKNTLIVMEAANTAENAVECFRFSENAEAFLTALQKTAPYEVQEDGSFVLKSGNLVITIQADVAANQFAYTAVDNDGAEIYSFYYPRPVHNLLIDTAEYTDLTTKNNLDLVKYAMDAEKKGWGYVWGTYGEVLDDGLLTSKCNQYPEEVGQKKEFIQTHWVGGRTTDCIGLIKGYCWLDPLTKQHGFAINGMADMGADQTFQSVSPENKGEITAETPIPEIPGLAVWHEGHIGVYIGDGKVVHAYTTQSGVVCTTFAEYGEWTHWLKVPGVTYIEPAPEPSQPTTPTEPTTPMEPSGTQPTEPVQTEPTAPTETQPTSTEGGSTP